MKTTAHTPNNGAMNKVAITVRLNDAAGSEPSVPRVHACPIRIRLL